MRHLLVALLLLTLGGCRREPPSAIVAKVKADGAGDVEHASDEALKQWMRKQGPKYARDLRLQMCVAAEKAGSSTWGDSTEGHVYKAAAGVAFFYREPQAPDTRTFTPGK